MTLSIRRTLLLALWAFALSAPPAFARGGGIDIGDGKAIVNPVPPGDDQASGGSQKSEGRESAPPTLIVSSIKFASNQVKAGETVSLVAEVFTQAAGQASGCWGTFSPVNEPTIEIPFDSCVAKRTGETSFQLALDYRVASLASSRAFTLNRLHLSQRGQVRGSWGTPWYSLVFRVAGNLLEPIMVESAWYETASGTPQAESGELFSLVVASKGRGRITNAILLYTLDQGRGPELRTAELGFDPFGTAEGREGYVMDQTRFSFSFTTTGDRTLHFEPLEVVLFNDALQETRSAIPADLPLKKSEY